MKTTKVHLVSTDFTANSNQNHFVTNRYIDFLEEQKSINQNLMNFASQINASCQTILHDIRKQESSLYLQKRTQKNNYIYLRTLLLEAVETSKSYGTHLSKQDQTINQLQRSFNRQRNFLNNLSIKQNGTYQTIFKQLEEYTQKLNNFQEHASHQLQVKFEEQKKVLSSVSIDQNKQYEQLLEEIALQKIQQEQDCLQLQTSVKEQNNHYENIETQLEHNNVDSIGKQHILEQTLLEYKKYQEAQQEEIKKLLEKIIYIKGSTRRLLSSLPPKYPIKQIISGGATIPLEHLLLVNEKTGIAYFSDGNKIVSIDIEKIDSIHWE